MNRNRLGIALVCALALVLSACGKEVDKGRVGAVKVEGTYNLYWFCDSTTLIYFEDNSGGDDEYVLVWPGACTADGKQKPMDDTDGQQANEPGGN